MFLIYFLNFLKVEKSLKSNFQPHQITSMLKQAVERIERYDKVNCVRGNTKGG